MNASTAVRALLLAVPLYAAPLVLFPSTTPVAEAKAKSKKSKAHKAPKDSDEAAERAPKVTAAAIVKWSRRGDLDSEIMAKVEAAGYTPSAKDAKLFKLKKLPSSLIAKLSGESEPAPVAKKPSVAKVEDLELDEAPAPAKRTEERAERTSHAASDEAPAEQAPRRKPIVPRADE